MLFRSFIIPCNWMDCIGVWVFSVFHLNYLFKFRFVGLLPLRQPIKAADGFHNRMPRQISGVGELLLICPPQLFHVRVGLDFIKGRRRVGKILLCTAFPGRCNERRTEISGDGALAVELAQNVQIIKVPSNTAAAVFRHGTSAHSASASVSPCLFVLRIA